MKKKTIIQSLKQRKDHSAWNKGVTACAIDMVDALEKDEISRDTLKTDLLNGAKDWNQYSYGGCGLIYDADIAEAFCTPSELKRKGGGRLPPNSRETWLDVQARALSQAYTRVLRIIQHNK